MEPHRGYSAVRGSAIRPVLRRRGEIHGVPARSAILRRNRRLIGPTGRNVVPHESAVACVAISSGNLDKSRRPPGPPSGRPFGECARFSGTPIRSAEIKRNRQIPDAIGRNVTPRGSAIDYVESSEIREKSRRPADLPRGRLFGKRQRFGEIPTRSAEIRRNRH